MELQTLQSNFTTQDQSKRMLKLGLPAESADCVKHHCYGHVSPAEQLSKNTFFRKDYSIENGMVGNQYGFPCWSVGRLLEMCKICGSYELAKEIYGRALFYKDTVDGIICEMAHEVNIGNIDLSKLNDNASES